MISTDAADCGLLLARRTDLPAARSVNVCGAQINPASALAATTAGEPRYTSASRSPMRPLKLRLVALIATSPFANQPAAQTDARAATGRQRNRARIQQRFPIAVGLGLRLHFGARRQRDKIRRRRRLVRRARESLRPRRANPRSARSRTTSNTPSEWAHAFAPFPAATPSSSLR